MAGVEPRLGGEVLQLSKDRIIRPIMAWAMRYPTVEVTGMVARRKFDGRDRVVPMQNIAKKPEAYYEWDPLEMSQEWSRMDLNDEEPIVFYHSHPNGRMDPSERDMEGALMPGIYHLVVYKVADGWHYSLWECIDAGILVSAQLEVTT